MGCLWDLQTAADKGEVAEALNNLMSLPGMEGYVVINFDGKYWNEKLWVTLSWLKKQKTLAVIWISNYVTYTEQWKLINLTVYTGIPVKYFPDSEDVIKPVQYAALFADLVKHTRFALKQLDIND